MDMKLVARSRISEAERRIRNRIRIDRPVATIRVLFQFTGEAPVPRFKKTIRGARARRPWYGGQPRVTYKRPGAKSRIDFLISHPPPRPSKHRRQQNDKSNRDNERK